MGLNTETVPILSIAMNPCKAPVTFRGTDGSMKRLGGCADVGSATTFVKKSKADHLHLTDQEICRTSFRGAVTGKPELQYTAFYSVPESSKVLPTPICVIPDNDWNFGQDIDALIGIPALAIADVDMSIRPDHFIIKYNNLGVEQKAGRGTP